MGTIYGALGIMLGISGLFILWQSYDWDKATWFVYLRYNKIIGYLTTALVAYLAARSFHPSRGCALLAACTSAVLFRLGEFALGDFALYPSHGPLGQRFRDGIWQSVGAAFSLGVLFGLVALWRVRALNAEPPASPNRGPTQPFGDSGISGEPPSVN